MLNKKDLSRRLSRRTFLNNKESDYIVNEIFDILIEEIRRGEDISIVGFGKFYLYEHAPRPVRNPKTQEEMVLKSYKSLRFKSSNVIKKFLKESVYEDEDEDEDSEILDSDSEHSSESEE
jgi:DNA-binding protein HU-beta